MTLSMAFAVPLKAMTALAGLVATVSATPCPPTLPIVDLGYERHQALTYDNTTNSYLFQNIRYAQPPTGNFRFRGPQPPLPDSNRHIIRNGSELRVCPQGIPEWQFKATSAATKFSNPNEEFSIEAWVETIVNAKVPEGFNINNGTTEDCLFLDVHVPKSVYEGRKKKKNGKSGAPVLAWIHGGGGVLGAKSGYPDQYMVPSGILSRASSQGEDLIFVAINYRLGALGYLDSPEVQADGDANIANLDQRAALNWIQDNIHLFGGDKHRVTAMGESGGGGSIILQMAAESEKYGPTPFANAIIQSPAISPTGKTRKGSYQEFLATLGVESLCEARAADSKSVIAANAKQVGEAPPSTYMFGNAIDSSLIPSSPMSIVSQGKFNKSVNVLMGHNAWEGAFFFDPEVSDDEGFAGWIEDSVPGLSEGQIGELVDAIYPAVFDGSVGYGSQAERQMMVWAEAYFDCNFQLMSGAIGGKGYAYRFSVPPSFHTQDLRYTFNAPGKQVPFPEAQADLQAAFVSFAQSGLPKTAEGEEFPQWGSESNLIEIGAKGAVAGVDGVNSTRCAWWANV
ncbi:carboxylesterase family protein [Sarocladium implicatum]|nr:carboxylesterase family protein [Sarocladium implicatum]